MASNDKTATVTGTMLVTPSSAASPVENIPFSMKTGTFTHLQKVTYTLATGASVTLLFTTLGMANDAHILLLTARDVTSGDPRSVELTFTAPGGAQGGIAAVNPSALVCSDFLMSTFDLRDFTSLAVQAQDSGAETEVTIIVGGS